MMDSYHGDFGSIMKFGSGNFGRRGHIDRHSIEIFEGPNVGSEMPSYQTWNGEEVKLL
jgi:hypothetical protein